MDEVTKQTVTTRSNGATIIEVTPPEEQKATNLQSSEYIIYFLFGALEILLAFRFFFKLSGAGLGSDFVNFIYNMSNIFVTPFQGIFPTDSTKGISTTAIFEPATILAILVFGVLTWGAIQLVRLISRKKQID